MKRRVRPGRCIRPGWPSASSFTSVSLTFCIYKTGRVLWPTVSPTVRVKENNACLLSTPVSSTEQVPKMWAMNRGSFADAAYLSAASFPLVFSGIFADYVGTEERKSHVLAPGLTSRPILLWCHHVSHSSQIWMLTTQQPVLTSHTLFITHVHPASGTSASTLPSRELATEVPCPTFLRQAISAGGKHTRASRIQGKKPLLPGEAKIFQNGI